MTQLKNLELLNNSVSKNLNKYCNQLVDLYGSGLKSVSIYGSAVGSGFVAKRSDINVLIVMDSIDRQTLIKYRTMQRKFKNIITSLFMTKKYIENSQDVYPIEFLEMKDNYLVVYGEDVLGQIDIDTKYLRLECEQQLKGSLIKMRNGLIKIGFSKNSFRKILLESFSSIIVIFRSLLRLKNIKPAVDKTEIINQMCDSFDINKDIFKNILEYKTGSQRKLDFEYCFDKYVEELENIIEKVDKM